MLPALLLLLTMQLPADSAGPPPNVVAIRASRAPTIDGRLNDAAWAAAPVTSRFRQSNPTEGAPSSEETEVRVLYDDAAIYVAARMHERDPSRIRAALTRRDEDSPSDLFTLALDSYHDHQTAMIFSVNPLGVRSDALAGNDQSSGDDSWDPIWEAATRVDSAGWTVEMRIPFSQLRFPPSETQTWGINCFRRLTSRNETDAYVLVRQNENGFASRFAHLTGIHGVRPSKRLELLPYARSQLESRRATPGDPFFHGMSTAEAVGVDVKYGVTSNLTLDATVNPDFGQVEADPAQLNLTVFESFFQERRPFFVEGAQIFDFGATGGINLSPGQAFYSRRIGRAPSLSPDLTRAYSAGDSITGPFTDQPNNTRILGAAKLSGKLAHGFSIGLLQAEGAQVSSEVDAEQLFGHRVSSGGTDSTFVVDRREHLRYADVVEPRAHYSVARARQDFRQGQTTVGLIATRTARDLDTPRLDSLFRRDANTLGVDWQHRWMHNRFSFAGNAVASRIAGSPSAITSAQESSARYFQRPDQTYVRVDTTRRSLSGATASAKLRYDGPQGFGATLAGNRTTPGYELNDLGFLTRADSRRVLTDVSWATPRPTRRFRRLAAEGGSIVSSNEGGERTGNSVFLNTLASLQNNWSLFVSQSIAGRAINATSTHGGPATESSPSRSTSVSLISDPRRALSGSASGFRHRTDFGTHAAGASAFVTWRPATNIQLSLGPSYDDTRERGYLVAAVADSLAVTTFGQRYVFATLAQRTLAIESRASVTFTPALSLQLYVQPFASGAAAHDFRELRRPRSLDFTYYDRDPDARLTRDTVGNYHVTLSSGGTVVRQFTIANPDEAFRSLRGSAVLRWEYTPGATLFAVWTHDRSLYQPGGAYDGVSDLGSLLRLPVHNVLLLKANYWLSR